MIWLQDPPWIRWTLALAIALVAVLVDLRGDGTVEHPFADTTIQAGELIEDANVEMRRVPSGLLPPVAAFGYASRVFLPGEPITPGGVAQEGSIGEPGWWALSVDVPDGAGPGDPVQLVLIDSGIVVPGRITSVKEDDPLASGNGSVAIPPEHVAVVASAVAAGRVVVLVSAS